MFKKESGFILGAIMTIIGIMFIVAFYLIYSIVWISGASICFFVIALIRYFSAKRTNDPNTIRTSRFYLISSIFMVVICSFILFMMFGGKITNPFDKSIWAKDYTPIEEFNYYIDGNNIYLKEYKGRKNKIKIGSTYTINGKEYRVADFVKETYSSKNFYSIIFPEGITYIPSSMLSSSELKYVYIPSTIKINETYSKNYANFKDLEKIYYGGTEEQWAIITNNVERSKIDAVQIICNANVNELVE